MFSAIKSNSKPQRAGVEQLSVLEVGIMASAEFKGVVGSIVEVAERLRGRAITPRTVFKVELGLDSLDQVALVNHLENTFSISIPDQEFDKAETIADLVALICEKRSGPA